MRIIRHLAVLAVIAAGLISAAPAQATPKPWIWSWWEGHWDNLDFVPHMEDAKHPQNWQWSKQPAWKPDDWIVQRDGAPALVQGFYDTDILRKQEFRDRIPVLVVGPGFYKLGGYDKRRVTKTLDQVYQITSSAPDAMYLIYDWNGMRVGAYTKYGLQIQ